MGNAFRKVSGELVAICAEKSDTSLFKAGRLDLRSISETNLQFQCETNSKIFAWNGNATDLHFIKDNQIDFICTHPPYANIIKYSKGIEGDISLFGVDDFLDEMQKVAKESFRVLKKGKIFVFQK